MAFYVSVDEGWRQIKIGKGGGVAQNTFVLFKLIQLVAGSSHINDSSASKYQRNTVVINYWSVYLYDYIAKKSYF